MKVFYLLAALLLAAPGWGQNNGGNGSGVGSLPREVEFTPEVIDFLVYSGYQVVQSSGLTMVTDWTTGGYAATSGSGTSASGVMPPVVMVTEWESNSGTQKVITPKKPHESFSNHAWRHANAVKALLNNEPSISNFTAGPDFGLFGTTRAAGSTMIASWTSDNGALTHQVRTEPKEGEDPAEQAYRHSQSVKALQAVFPPDKTVTPPKTGMRLLAPATGFRLVA